MDTSTTALDAARDLLAGVAASRISELRDDELCAFVGQVEEVGRLVDALRVLGAAEVDERSAYGFGADGLAQRNGHSKGVHFIEWLTRVSQAEATRRVRLGTAVRPSIHVHGVLARSEFDVIAGAVTRGEIGLESAAQITRCLRDSARTAGAADLERAESALVEVARTEAADLVRQHALVWREHLDPDGAEPRDERLWRRRGFALSRERDGISTATMTVDPLGRATLNALFGESCGPRIVPRFLSDGDRADAGVQGDATDPRSRSQQQYDVIMGTLTAGMRAVGVEPESMSAGEMRSTAKVVAVITMADLENRAGVGWLDGVVEPVSARSVEQLVCDAGYQTLLLGENGEVLHLGRNVDMFTGKQRLAMAARDGGGCVWPGCDQPTNRTEGHHVCERSNNGPTNVENGALLCAAHHHLLHHSDYLMKMIGGIPHLLAPIWVDRDQRWRRLGRLRPNLRR